ncbi:MAG TPA: carboxypeptidase-like regulatory domain-containing protein, partial [Bryobacteraceae bacterium]
MPNAKVKITNVATGLSKEANVDASGRYSLVNVLPGKYDINVTSSGFRAYTATGFDVVADTVGRMDVKLEVGQISDSVTVSATGAALQTDKS